MRGKTQNRLIFAGIAALLAGVFVVLVYLPQGRRQDEVRSHVAKMAVQIDQDTAEAIRIPQLREDVGRLKREFHDFDRRLPRQQELAGFLTEISEAVQVNQLANYTIEPGSPTAGDLYNRLPILMNFNCNFTSLVAFLDKLNRMTRLMRVERVQVTPIKPEGGDLRVQMQINIYFTKS